MHGREWSVIACQVAWAFPAVEKQLARYLQLVAGHDSPAARHARISMRTKRFHCQGGAVFACLSPRRPHLLAAIVALQTICDYLDNLCDREDPPQEARFRRLHRALLAAVQPDVTLSLPTDVQDGGLLPTLVRDTRAALVALPSYPVVEPEVIRLARLYTDLQSYKHLPPGEREEALVAHYQRDYRLAPCDGSSRPATYGGVTYGSASWCLAVHEFAAACGSTLGIFTLLRAAARPGLTRQEVESLREAYFPRVCALHILLDYLIDMEEDRLSGDLNFVAPYGNLQVAAGRLAQLTQMALEAVSRLPEAALHRLVVKGLVAMYLSDPKAEGLAQQGTVEVLLRAAGPPARRLWQLCRLLRRSGFLGDSWQPPRLRPVVSARPEACGERQDAGGGDGPEDEGAGEEMLP